MSSLNTSVNREPGATDSEPGGPITAATRRLVATAESFSDDDLGVPSLCPGWTRAHVLSHVARNADALVNLLTWARTGTPTYQYESADQRESDIDQGVGRPIQEVTDDLKASAERFARAVNDMPDDGWAQLVNKGPGGQGEAIPARRVLWSRLLEVEVHHVDLAADYSPADWPAGFVQRALAETMQNYTRRPNIPSFSVSAGQLAEQTRDGAETAVSGTPGAALSWLIGRSDGSDLTVTPAGELPALPAWK